MVSFGGSSSLLLLALSLFSTTATAATNRGLALGIEPLAEADLKKLTNAPTTIKWYYTWNMYPNKANAKLGDALKNLRAKSDHLLTFNEPDMGKDRGGNPIDPGRAAQLYIDHIMPLQEKGWKISHPVVSGSPDGLAWLKKFRDACKAKKPGKGCAADFVSVHWYGNMDGLKNHMNALRDFYQPTANNMKFYVTELAYPQVDEAKNLQLIKDASKYFDSLNWVEGYAWFGSFRQKDANGWTKGGVALMKDNGDLTSVGKFYVNK
ncbi:uncharacterized protein PG998_009234 [Apiospora kogelbergensis]|uniref:uncharacterized protein n=1 Tax=Apiospora kogelbergensis TaxID=1337665 RepID=UPI00312D320B